MSFLIFGAIYCFSGGCLFVCFFLMVQATIFWWDILSLGRIMSSDKLESFLIRFTGKNYST